MSRFKIPTGVKIFAVIWLLILALPPTREVFQAYFFSRYFNDPTMTAMVSTQEQQAERLHKKYPDSIEMTLWYSQLMYWNQGSGRTIANLDALRKKFPENLQIAATELQLISNGTYQRRIPKQTPAVKADLMEKAAQIAFESGHRQPDNAFWPMMESGFYFYAKQNALAIEALQRLNRCTNYEDFGLQILRGRLQFIENHEPIIWEQKVAIWSSTSSPYLLIFKRASEAATEEALKAKRQGNNQQALEIIAPMLKGFEVMSRESQSFMGSRMAEGMADDTLKVFFARREKRGMITSEERLASLKSEAQAWAQFATRNGHPELARLTDFVIHEQGDSELYLYRANPSDTLGLRSPWGPIALSSIPTLFWVSVLSIICGLIWAINALIFRGDAPENQPHRGQVTSCVIFSFWALCGLIVLAIYLQWLALSAFFFSYSNNPASTFPLMLPPLIVGIWLLPVYFQSQKRKVWRIRNHAVYEAKDEFEPLSAKQQQDRKIAWVAYVLSNLFMCISARYVLLIVIFAAIAIVSLVIALRLEFLHQRAKRLIKSDLKIDSPATSLKTRVLRLVLWGTFLLCLAMAMAQISWQSRWTDFIPLAIVGFGSLVGAVLNETKAKNAGFVFVRKLATQSAGAFAILWGLCFIFGSMGLWPLRAELNRQWAHRMEVREIDWTKEQYEKNK